MMLLWVSNDTLFNPSQSLHPFSGTASAAAPLRGPRNMPLPAKQIPTAEVNLAMPQRRLLTTPYYYSPSPYGYSPAPYGA